MAWRPYYESMAGMGWNYVWSIYPLWSSLDIPHTALRFYQAFGLARIEVPEMASAGNICLTKKKLVRHKSQSR